MAETSDRNEIFKAFKDAVNMSPSELEEWLQSDTSRAVGWKGEDGKGEGESVGHASGRRIVKLMRKRKVELTGDDYAHMRKVVGYVRRHSAQQPENTVTSRWRYSLMNWGHDPTKED